MGTYQNSQNSQLSPRLSQGSPAPPSYPTGGALLPPQVSPTGHNPTVQVPQGQQSPAWSGSSPQHRPSLQQQNTMINNPLNVRFYFLEGRSDSFDILGVTKSVLKFKQNFFFLFCSK